MKRGSLSQDERVRVLAQIADAYAAGDSIRAIARHAGFSYTAIRLMLLSQGVELRARHTPALRPLAADNPRTVPCERCGARMREGCISGTGGRLGKQHAVRVRAAKAAVAA